MKQKIHPRYYRNAKIKCSCGNIIEIGSTVEKIDIEICSTCHPFYTGKKRLLDITGRVERFNKKYNIKK